MTISIDSRVPPEVPVLKSSFSWFRVWDPELKLVIVSLALLQSKDKFKLKF